MNEITKGGRNFIGYEYKEIFADREKASLYLDGYLNFGWKIDGNIQPTLIWNKVFIKLKRDRKILNKAELTRLQRHFEASLKEVETMDSSKAQSAMIWSLMVGIIGTAFMAGSVFAVIAAPPLVLLCAILAVPALVGWTLPYFIYKRLLQQQVERITPLIEQKYDEIYEVCEKGNKLL